MESPEQPVRMMKVRSKQVFRRMAKVIESMWGAIVVAVRMAANKPGDTMQAYSACKIYAIT